MQVDPSSPPAVGATRRHTPYVIRVGAGTVSNMTRPATTALPLPLICPANGISNYQDAAVGVTRGDPVRIVHEPDNPYDTNACRIETAAGATLGYVPAGLAGRLLARGETAWSGVIIDVLDAHQTVGLRVRITAATPAPSPVAETSDTVRERPRSGEKPRPVTTKHSRRPLGTFAGRDGSMILVSKGDVVVRYPAELVEVD